MWLAVIPTARRGGGDGENAQWGSVIDFSGLVAFCCFCSYSHILCVNVFNLHHATFRFLPRADLMLPSWTYNGHRVTWLAVWPAVVVTPEIQALDASQRQTFSEAVKWKHWKYDTVCIHTIMYSPKPQFVLRYCTFIWSMCKGSLYICFDLEINTHNL